MNNAIELTWLHNLLALMEKCPLWGFVVHALINHYAQKSHCLPGGKDQFFCTDLASLYPQSTPFATKNLQSGKKI